MMGSEKFYSHLVCFFLDSYRNEVQVAQMVWNIFCERNKESIAFLKSRANRVKKVIKDK